AGALELPLVGPGERAAVAIPDWQVPPDDGREALLTMIFATAEDEVWAHRGHEVGWGQLEIRPAAARSRTETTAASTPVHLDDEGLLVHPLLARPPKLSFWRAPTDNDRILGIGARWTAAGLDRPQRRLLSSDRDGPEATVQAEYVLADGRPIHHEQFLRALDDGSVEIRERVNVPDGLTDPARGR